MTSELTDGEQSALACRCDTGICPLHNEASDGYVEHQASDLLAAVERILTAREAAVERRGAVNALLGAADEWEQEDTDAVGDWLRDRANRVEAGDA